MSEFFLIVLAIILISGFFRRYIFFFLMRALSKKLFRDFNKMQGRGNQGPFRQNPYQRRPEGTVIIDDKNAQKKQQNNPVSEAGGEYVDFEEIKD